MEAEYIVVLALANGRIISTELIAPTFDDMDKLLGAVGLRPLRHFHRAPRRTDDDDDDDDDAIVYMASVTGSVKK